VFSSANGVRYLLERLRQIGAARQIDRVKLAAIGPGTADELARYQLRTVLVPKEFRAVSLAEALVREAPGRRFLLARASRGREVLAEQLAAAGATVQQVVVYSSSDVETPDPHAAEARDAGEDLFLAIVSMRVARTARQR
jgi:uroporphyrinogen III methyltransferase/synthase